MADRCLYGVDINPMAVEMAKLSLWLVTLQRDRPFSFLDHALKCGDSLLGVISAQQIENFSLRPGERQITFATANLSRLLDEASAKRRVLEGIPSNDHTQIETKQRLHMEAEAATARVKALADALIAFELRDLDGEAYEEQRTDEAENVQFLMERDADASQPHTINQLTVYASEQLRGRRTFHWPVEFPEVLALGGFDAIVGNPPFIGGHDISGLFGYDYRSWLAKHLFGKKAGLADICAFFAVRGHALIRPRATIGLVATNSITEGDSKKVGLGQIVAAGSHIVDAWLDLPWPGNAAVVISPFISFRGRWNGPTLSASLSLAAQSEPHSLASNQDRCFVGCYVLGGHFELDETVARTLLTEQPQTDEVILPYINGVELNAFSDLRPRRWIICFWDWPEQAARRYKQVFQYLEASFKEAKADSKSDVERRRWWLYARSRPALYHAIGLGHLFAKHPPGWRRDKAWPSEVIVKAKTSETWAFAFIASATILDQALTVFSSDDRGLFAILQSTLHEVWTRDSGAGSKMKTDLRYAPTAFEAFPLPGVRNNLVQVGAAYEACRGEIMLQRVEGLTDTYNRFNDQSEQSEDIARLRALQVGMDQAVAAAYNWSSVDLGHGFHKTKQGVRYTVSESAHRTVLDRLLALNHQRYAEEIKAGLHNHGAMKATRGRPKRKDNAALKLFG